MKQKITLFFAIFCFSTLAYSHSDKSHKAHSQHNAKGKELLLSGHLIGLTCFVKHGSSGAKHRSCAKICAQKGLPIGLKTSDGKIYFVSGEGHDSLVEAYKPLLKYLEFAVTIKGEVFEKDNQKIVVIKKIKKS